MAICILVHLLWIVTWLLTCMECHAVGLVSSADVQAVLGQLQALAGSAGCALKVHETVLRHGTPTVASLRIRTPLNQDDTVGTRSAASVQLDRWARNLGTACNVHLQVRCAP